MHEEFHFFLKFDVNIYEFILFALCHSISQDFQDPQKKILGAIDIENYKLSIEYHLNDKVDESMLLNCNLFKRLPSR